MKEYKEYKGKGCPVLADDYVDVKLFDGQKKAAFGRDFTWWIGRAMSKWDIEFYRLRGSALSPAKQPGSPDTLIKFTKYNGKGCPFNDDDYLRVKLISGKIVCKFAAQFSWWTNIDEMNRNDLAQLDIDSYSLMTPRVQTVTDNKIKYDGGGCPVDGETIVLYWRVGNSQPFSNQAKYLKWRMDGQPVSEDDVEYFAFPKLPIEPGEYIDSAKEPLNKKIHKTSTLNEKIKYDGKGCPVDLDTIVEIWLTNEYSKTETGEAGEFSWGDGKELGDIAFFRVIEDKIKYDGNGQPVSDDSLVRVWWSNDNSEVHIAGNIFWPRSILNHSMDLKYYQVLKRGKSGQTDREILEKDFPLHSIPVKPVIDLNLTIHTIPINMKMTDKATTKDWKYNEFRHAGWSDEQLLKEGFMVEKSPSEVEMELITRQFARLNPIRDTKEKIKKLADEFIQSLKDSRNITDGKKLNICLACGKQISNGKGVEINGDLFHTDYTPEGDPDYSKVAENWINIVNVRKHGKEPDVRSHNVGDSDYAEHEIQPWDIWLEYDLNGWDCDIVKRVLRNKESQSRRMDYEKIIHDCQERIRQIDDENEKGAEHF